MKKEGIIYLYFKEKMEQHADIDGKEISLKQAKWVLSKNMIPKCLRQSIINEMISLGLLKYSSNCVLAISSKAKVPLSKDFFEF